ncbi:MAG: cysteine--tRNA ligase [Candidatus Portnoybacteria bacterium]|nr:cysteine--tRNA ligase [Candidatus Portnoybacteria bacterium]
MVIKLYNTLSRKKEVFKPIKKGQVGIYTCGPTVYSYQHIGNLRSYIFADILKKVLEYGGYRVKQIINVTDVGHLTSDADAGEDKIEKAAEKEGKKTKDIARYYWKIFKDDFVKLNISEPSVWTWASKYIQDQIDFIKVLDKKGFVYKTSDGLYFDTSKIKDYGKMANLDVEGLRAGKRVDLKEKKNITDFALWKFSEKAGIRQQEWDSPWGLGFPGWHLECSVMSIKHLGERFDIHTGGLDHVPVHHSNERAQNIAYAGHSVVNYWIHGAFLVFKGEKISKSKGGLYTVSELEDKGFNSLSFRYLCFNVHYRSPLNFSLKALKGAEDGYERLKNILADIEDDGSVNKEYLSKFEKCIFDDLDMPGALSVLWNMIRDKKASGKIGAVKEMDKVFGLDLLKKEKVKVPEVVEKLVKKREEARKSGDWNKADQLREEIKEMGYAVEDSPSGSKIKPN